MKTGFTKYLFAQHSTPVVDPAWSSAQDLVTAEDELDQLLLRQPAAAEDETPEFQAANERVCQAERRLVEAVPTTVHGTLAKICYLDRYMAETCSTTECEEQRVITQLVESVLTGLQNMTQINSTG